MVTRHIHIHFTKPIQQKGKRKKREEKTKPHRTLHFDANTFMADKNQIHIKILFQLSWIAFNFHRCVCWLRRMARKHAHTHIHKHHVVFVYARFYMASLVYLFIYLFGVFHFIPTDVWIFLWWTYVCMGASSADANVCRFVLLMLVSSSPPPSSLLLVVLLEFRYESFYSRQSSNIVHEATYYIGRYASKPNDPNSPIVSNKTRGKQIATNQSKSKTNLIYAILGFMRPT